RRTCSTVDDGEPAANSATPPSTGSSTPTTADAANAPSASSPPSSSSSPSTISPRPFTRHDQTQPPSTKVAADPVLDPRVVANAVLGAGLSQEQVAMVDQVCRSGAGVDVIEGVAGSGKTAALAVANNAWMTSGLTVRGCALAARAAAGLQAASGMLSTTVDGFLRRIERGDVVLGPNDVVVVDEAGMVGTRKLARVLDHADRARAKVVLIGDPRQLPEIDGGGAFAALTRSVGHVALATNRRQLERWERRALAGVRVGRDDALRAYERRGRIHECDDAQRAMVSSWVTVRE